MMDQVKIGMFISEQRKKQNLTQLELADKLGITDRAISKWENGRSMPDSSLMLDLCQILNISVNELLCGEVLKMDRIEKKQEELLLEMVKEKEEADKRFLKIEIVLGILSFIILLVPIFIAAFVELANWKRLLLILSGFIPAFIGFMFAARVEQVAGYYECQKCGHHYVPTFKAVVMAMHTGRTRYMKCPKCGERTWQKKVISKD